MLKKVIRTATIPLSLDILLEGQLAFLSQYYEVVAVSGEDEHLCKVSNREKVRTVNIPMQRTINPFQDLISLWKLYWFFRKERPDVVHSITPKAGLLSMTAAYFACVPVRMHTFTGLIFPSKTGILQKILIQMDRLLCFFATHIYPEGKGVKQDLMQYRITAKPLRIIANGNVNGINTVYFNRNQISVNRRQELKNQLRISETDFVFIFVGRLVSAKGINELVKAFVKLCGLHRYSAAAQKLQPKLLLVGPFEHELDPLTPETLTEIKSNPLIITVGFQEGVRPYFAVSNALVFPSYREGFPNVVLQSLAMELPAIVTDINGCNEIIGHEQNGLVVPVKDTEALEQAMEELLNNGALYQSLKNTARESVFPYEQQKVWDALLEEYHLVAG